MATARSPASAPFAENLPTPPASSAAPSQHPSPLPQPRKHPLKPGGPRESDLIRYLDHGINSIQKRVDNRMTNRKLKPEPGEEQGYSAFWEVARDLDGLVDVVWVSASRKQQHGAVGVTGTDVRHMQRTSRFPICSTLPF